MNINLELPDSPNTAALIEHEILEKDCYRLRTIKVPPRIVYDIGANIGFFSIAARVLWPQAIIRAFEPCPETFALLQQNAAYWRIDTENSALALGDVRIARDQRSDGSHYCLPGGAVAGATLGQIIGPLAAEPYLVKLDCEGGELVLFNDQDSLDALALASHWAMEYHPNRTNIPAGRAFVILAQADPRARRELVTSATDHTDERWLFWSHQG